MRTQALLVIILSFAGPATRCQNLAPALGFLQIEPDARASGMGLTGVATSPDNFTYYNPAKIGLQNNAYGLSGAYTPYLQKLANGMGLACMEGFRKMDEDNTIGIEVRYFTLSKIAFKDAVGYDIYSFNPSEWAVGLTYARKLSDFASFGLTARYINSRPAAGIEYQGAEIRTAGAVGADIGYYYSSVGVTEQPGYTGGIFRLGLSLQNLGTKVKYLSGTGTAFQPMIFRGGLSYSLPMVGDQHQVSFSGELTKLLLPSPALTDQDGNIISGKDPDQTSVPAAFFSGWTESAGWGGGFGIEYLYQQRFFLRIGGHYESPDISSKQLATFGMGCLLGTFHCDLSYFSVISARTGAANYQSQTVKLTLGINISE